MEADDNEGAEAQLECEVCGSSNFYSESGFYYCGVCNTQSQQTRQYVEAEDEEYARAGNVRQAGVLRAPKAKDNSGGKGKKFLSSWEVHNYTLKGMTDKLILIGFPALLKDKAFQLWKAYLLKREVIFVETDDDPKNNRSAVSLGEPKLNILALYDRERPTIRQPSKYKKSEHASARELKRRATIARKKAFETDYLARNAKDSEDHTEKETPEEPLRFTRSAAVVLDSLKNARKEFTHCHNKNKWETPVQLRRARSLLVHEQFTLLDVLVILYISCRQIGCRVVFTDFVRLVCDGTLYVDSLKHLMGETEYYKYNLRCDSYLRRSLYHGFRDPTSWSRRIENFIQYTGIKKFRYPTVSDSLPKYIDDSCLPKELEGLLIQINKMYSEDDQRDLRKDFSPYTGLIEIEILSRLGMLLKMLFGLDDVTERYQSRFASTVNDILKRHLSTETLESNSTGGWTQLFDIKEWFEFIRYRNNLVKQELNNPLMYIPGKTPNYIRTHELLNRYSETGGLARNAETAATKREFFDRMTRASYEGEVREVPDYVSLPLPNQSIVKQYQEAYPNVSYPDLNSPILNWTFERKRVDFIYYPEKYIPLLRKAGYKVNVIAGDAINCKKDLPFKAKTLYLFQPYKKYDDFIGPESQCPHSMQFVLNFLSSYLFVKNVSGDNHNPIIRNLINRLGNLYARRCLSGFVPLPTSHPYEEDELEPEIELKHCVKKKKYTTK